MLDINIIRENPNYVKDNLKRRVKIDINKIDDAVKMDKEWRELKSKIDSLRNERNKLTLEITKLRQEDKDVTKLVKKAKGLPADIKKNEEKLDEIRRDLDEILVTLPNLLHESVPQGKDENDNKVEYEKGKKIKFNFRVKDHQELLKDLLDIERATKLSGSGFYLFKGELAKLQRALIQFMLDFHVNGGFEEVNVPQLVNYKTAFGTGNLPKFENDLYKTIDGFYLIPTAEVPVTNLFANEVLSEYELPKKFVAYTQCYRTEAGQHGSETPGIFRVHQFEKVEMVYICNPKDSWKLHEEMTKRAEKILDLLEIPYRRIVLCSGDASFASAKTYDIEVWSPAMNKYLETSSCSNCTDFQARRMNTKFLISKTNERKYVHTLNGSGLATPRLLIALVENYQQEDGSIRVPKALLNYMNGKNIIGGKLNGEG